MSFFPISGTQSSSHTAQLGREPSPNKQLASWLAMVEYHSQSGSSESMQTLKQLAETIPDCQNLTPAEQDIIDKVKNIAREKAFDPTLSPASKGALTKLIELPENSPVRRKLNFEDAENVW